MMRIYIQVLGEARDTTRPMKKWRSQMIILRMCTQYRLSKSYNEGTNIRQATIRSQSLSYLSSKTLKRVTSTNQAAKKVHRSKTTNLAAKKVHRSNKT